MSGLEAMDVLDKFVGFKFFEAEEMADKFGWVLRVIKENGKDLPYTDDYIDSRANVEVTNGVIVRVYSIG